MSLWPAVVLHGLSGVVRTQPAPGAGGGDGRGRCPRHAGQQRIPLRCRGWFPGYLGAVSSPADRKI